MLELGYTELKTDERVGFVFVFFLISKVQYSKKKSACFIEIQQIIFFRLFLFDLRDSEQAGEGQRETESQAGSVPLVRSPIYGLNS